MLEILQTRNFENYREKIELLGIADTFPNVVEAKDGENVKGYGIYHIDIPEQKVVIDDAQADGDLYLFDGIIRSVLFLAMMKGIETAEFADRITGNAKKLGFVQNNDNLLSPLSEFMSKCKSCGK